MSIQYATQPHSITSIALNLPLSLSSVIVTDNEHNSVIQDGAMSVLSNFEASISRNQHNDYFVVIKFNYLRNLSGFNVLLNVRRFDQFAAFTVTGLTGMYNVLIS